MHVYAKFMKVLFNGKHKLKYYENITLVEECSIIIQRKLPPKLTDPCRFTIACTIGSLKIGEELCDLGESTNLIPLSMLENLICGEPNITKISSNYK